ncbi:hypothetical protein [Burkholderia multivorans]|uniref:hypothetical protein n=1 Tax=Burkholderia multivorans TaxID=87883 RepID=UPI001FC88974|nr:hypothetical protein [Burkholderia multivorans]
MHASHCSRCLRDANGLITVELAEADDVSGSAPRCANRIARFSAISGMRSDRTSVDEASVRDLMRWRVALTGALSRLRCSIGERACGMRLPFVLACVILAKHLRGTGSRMKLPYKAY